MNERWVRLHWLARSYLPHAGLLLTILAFMIAGMQIAASLALRQPATRLLEGEAYVWKAERKADYSRESTARQKELSRGVVDLAIVQDALQNRAARNAAARDPVGSFVPRSEVRDLLQTADRIAEGIAPSRPPPPDRDTTDQAATAARPGASSALPGSPPDQLIPLSPVVSGDAILAFGSARTPTPTSAVLALEGGRQPTPAAAPQPVSPTPPSLVGPAPAPPIATAAPPTRPPESAPVPANPTPTAIGLPTPGPSGSPTTGPTARPGSPTAPPTEPATPVPTTPAEAIPSPTNAPDFPTPTGPLPATPTPFAAPPATVAPNPTFPPAPTEAPVEPTLPPAPTLAPPSATPPPTATPWPPTAVPTDTPRPSATPSATPPPSIATPTIPDNFEPNNTCDQAAALGLGNVIAAYLSRSGDIDFYRVEITEVPTELIVDLAAPSADVEVTLYSSCLSLTNPVGTVQENGTAKTARVVVRTAGPAIIVVSSRSGAAYTNPYSLRAVGFRLPTATPSATPTPIPPATATPSPTRPPVDATRTPPTQTPLPTVTATPDIVQVQTGLASGAIFQFGNTAPGTDHRAAVALRNDSSLPFDYFLSDEVDPTTRNSVLWTDTVNGLRLQVWRTNNPNVLLYDGPLQMPRTPVQMTRDARLNPGAEDRLSFRVFLSANAGNAYQGKSVTVTFIWTAQG